MSMSPTLKSPNPRSPRHPHARQAGCQQAARRDPHYPEMDRRHPPQQCPIRPTPIPSSARPLHCPRAIQQIFSKSAHLPSASGKLQLTPNTEYGHQPRSGCGRVRDLRARHSELHESQDTQNTTTKLLPNMFSSHGSLLTNLSQWRHEGSRKIMERVPMQEFQITNTGDELGRSCVPQTLLPIVIDTRLQRALDVVETAIGDLAQALESSKAQDALRDCQAPSSKIDKIKASVTDFVKDLPSLCGDETNPKDNMHTTLKLTDRNKQRIQQSEPGGSLKDWEKDIVSKCQSKAHYPALKGLMSWDKPAPATTQFCYYGTGCFGQTKQDRTISSREAAILQIFPKSYEFSQKRDPIPTHVMALLIGNAISAKLEKAIDSSILEASNV